ncbi:MAG: 3-phosphoshikimate 1-carboxyvinyltransferase [Rhodospirillaceae bacterium]|nr:3-phosphoshikimate 1-carboxyvinyltransferase [Rhodospirillaceae bacterium]
MSHSVQTSRAAVSGKAKALSGRARVPGDKSISHRALIMGGLAVGETTVTGLLMGEDVLRTAAVMAALGAKVEETKGTDGSPLWKVWGRGIGGLSEPADVLDMGNSGTGARLIAGLVSAYPFTSFMTGDASLRRRPMDRIIKPLSQSGARFTTRAGGRLPMAVTGTPLAMPLTYDSPIASAQVKSAVLLAGLHAGGVTTVTEPVPSRDHTERMFRHFGVDVRVENGPLGGETWSGRYKVQVQGQPELTGRPINVPADPSSAAFLVVSALLVPGSHLILPNIGINPLRTGLFDTLQEMGGDIAYTNRRLEAGEPVADLEVKYSKLKGIPVPAERAPSMIDEYPILAVAAACADGVTTMLGLEELKVKESDRLTAMAVGLEACGVTAEAAADSLTVKGGRTAGGVTIAVNLDHRIAMSFLVLGMVSDKPIAVDDATAIATSFPDFMGLMNGLGADMRTVATKDVA